MRAFSFEEFWVKFVHEAEQNRVPQIRLGQEIANRTRLYFNDYLEDLSADMPGVEQWKEPLSDKVHYRWCPQKDCFYIDENIDNYLRELYEFVRMRKITKFVIDYNPRKWITIKYLTYSTLSIVLLVKMQSSKRLKSIVGNTPI